MGWSSWSLQSTNYPGVNPGGGGSWISAKNILILAVGADAYRGGVAPIVGAPGCTTKDIVYPDLRTTNGWDSNDKIDYTSPCSQAYANSIANLLASWGVDFLKMDGVGPGSFKGGPNYDNTEDVKAWSTALKGTGRPIQFVISWALSHRQADVWKANTNGWRIDTDVECYCNSIVTWDQSVKGRWNDVVQWIDDAGPGHWNNLDAVDVGVGAMDGITEAERQSYMTLWAVSAAPLFSGDDLTKLDKFGLSLLTNREVIAIDQAAHPARPVSQKTPQQVWHAKNPNGSFTVALFNLGSEPANVTANFRDVGIDGAASVRDVWKGKKLGVLSDHVSATLPAHGSQLLTITPTSLGATAPSVPTTVRATDSTGTSVSLAWKASSPTSGDSSSTSYRIYDAGTEVARTTSTDVTVNGLSPSTGHAFTVQAFVGAESSGPSTALSITTPGAAGRTVHEAEAPENVLEGTASRTGCGGCSGGGKVGNLGGSSSFTFTSVQVPVAGDYLVSIGYVDGGASRQAVFTVNGTSSFGVNFQGSNDNDWDTAQTQNVLVHLDAGVNTIKVGNPDSYVSDLDAVTL
ncbi:CBM35 domain-containing protein [Pengzhenrongella sp.]|jgi:hypothetical protein|uniref:CBM35 domain-containing protein n=1 Tax=Pengzhenrongella sp. TaxID=2888820 RepID=UPI002F93E1DC